MGPRATVGSSHDIADSSRACPIGSAEATPLSHHRAALEDTRNTLCQLRVDTIFLQTWLFTIVHRVAREGTRYKFSHAEASSPTLEEELRLMQDDVDYFAVIREQLLELQRALAVFLLGPTQPSPPIPRSPPTSFMLPPQMFVRGFQDASYCTYTPEMGIRSSDFCTPASSFKDLMGKSGLYEESFRNHCEAVPGQPTCWISMTDDVHWLLEKSAFGKSVRTDNDTRKIAFINASKMNSLGILFERSDLLASGAAISKYSWNNPEGVKFTSYSHWLAYGWIPPQCIEQILPFHRARELYSARVRKGANFQS